MTTNSSQQVAKALLSINAVGFSPHNPVTFKSGIISPVYVDNRQLIHYPAQWHVVVEAFQNLIISHQLEFDVIGGVAVGGVPHSSVVAFQTETPSIFIRKEAKEHGKGKRIEGGDVIGKTVLLLEDLVTTGGSSLSGVEALREAGATVVDMIAIVSYGFSEANQNFADAEVNLHTLTNFRVIMDIALSENRFTLQEANMIQEWFDNPHQWKDKYA